MAKQVAETTSTTTTSEEDDSPTLLGMLGERIGGFFGVFWFLAKFLFRVAVAAFVIVVLGTILSTTEKSRWIPQDLNDIGVSELHNIEITEEELDAYSRLMDVAESLQYADIEWRDEKKAKEFVRAYFPESYDADVKSIVVKHASKNVQMEYVASGGNKKIHLDFERGHITKTIWLYHGFTENDFGGMLYWYAYGRFHAGYPCYIYSQDVSNGYLSGNLSIRKQTIRLRLYGLVFRFWDVVKRMRSVED